MKSSIILSGIAATALLAGFTGAANADEVKFGYINKMGEHPWFVAEVAGAKAEAGKLGVNLMTQDVHFDANLALTTFDTMVGDGVKAIAIVVPDKALGPVVAEKAEKAGIRLIAVDDDIYTSDKKMVPYVGMNAENIGRQVGAEDARIYKAEGWDKFKDVQNRQHRGPEGRHLHAAQPRRGSRLPRGRPRFRQGQYRPHPLRQSHGERGHRGHHDLDRPSRSQALDLLFLQRRRRAWAACARPRTRGSRLAT